jgi:hypothetical protein
MLKPLRKLMRARVVHELFSIQVTKIWNILNEKIKRKNNKTLLLLLFIYENNVDLILIAQIATKVNSFMYVNWK